MAKRFYRNVTRVVPVFALVGLLAGCSNALLISVKEHVTEVNTPKEPVIEISEGATAVINGYTADFESQPTGSDTDISFSIKNTGTGNLLLQTPIVNPSSVTDGFSLLSLSGTSVSPGDSVNLVLRFHPSSGGTHNASVTVESNSTTDPSLVFSVTGVGVVPDTNAPTGSVSISNGNSYAINTSVFLTISATDTGGGFVQQMEIRNDTAFTGNWQSYDTSVIWTLDGPDGTDTVYIRFRDNSGNISNTYSDTIILDRVNPTITSRTPSSGASNISRGSDITIIFSEDIDQSTLTSSSVYLRIKGGAIVDTDPDSYEDWATLMPTSNLLYGYDYSIVVTSAVKDLSGRSISNSGTTDFTVERDYWEGTTGNESPSTAYDLDTIVPGYYEDTMFDMVPDIQEETETWSFPTGVHSKLALLEGIDYYVVDPPDDMYIMEVRVLFTNDEVHGTTVDSSGSENITLGVINGGQGHGAFLIDTHTFENYDKYYELDLSGRTGDFAILIYENSGNYTNRRKYNLRIRFSTGM